MGEVEDPLLCRADLAISFVTCLDVSLAHFPPLISIDVFLIDLGELFINVGNFSLFSKFCLTGTLCLRFYFSRLKHYYSTF